LTHVYENGLCECAMHVDRRWWLTQVLFPVAVKGRARKRRG
jgi:hypothetical protein